MWLGPFILLQEAETHFQEIANIAAQQFDIYQGADQLILFPKHTFEPGGVKTEDVIPGTSKLWLEIFDGKVDVQEAAQTWILHVHSCLCALEQDDGEEARRCKGVLARS